MLEYCEKHDIGFIPWFPLGGRRPREIGVGARRAARKRKAPPPSQIALAWLLKRSPVMLPIPGTVEGGSTWRRTSPRPPSSFPTPTSPSSTERAALNGDL